MDAGPVLVLRALGLGDALTGIPALRGLRRLLAPRPVLLAASEPVGRWLTDLDVVDGWVATTGLDGPAPGRNLGRHDAVDLHGNGPASRTVLTDAGPRRLLAFASPDASAPDAQASEPLDVQASEPTDASQPRTTSVGWREDEHEVHRWCRLVAAIGARCDAGELRITHRAAPLPTEPGRGAAGFHDHVVLHPGAASGSRRWPPDRWTAVARALRAAGHRVLLTGGPDERELC
ncbi:MAG: glycosyltransferase family 9 protein, partial [Angustibacter sp.]